MPRGLRPREALAWLLSPTVYGANRKRTMSPDDTSAVLGFASGANINERELPCLPRIAVPARWAVRGGGRPAFHGLDLQPRALTVAPMADMHVDGGRPLGLMH